MHVVTQSTPRPKRLGTICAFALAIILPEMTSAQDPQDQIARTKEQLNAAHERAQLTRKPLSSVLAEVITESAPARISSTLSRNVLGLDASAFTSTDAVSKLGAPPNIENLPTYQQNVTKSVEDAIMSSGPLRVWEGGLVEKPDEYLETVLLAGNGSICTGVLVAPKHVITAAHCYCRGVTKTALVGTTVSEVIASSDIDIEKSYTHIPCNELATPDETVKNIGKGDYALYTLKSEIKDIQFRTIAREKFVRSAAAVRALGFGKTPQSIGGVKFLVDIQIGSYDCTEVEINSGGTYRCVPHFEMVAKGLNRDTCGGDSGGPLYVLGPDVKLYVAAVTSRSLDPDGKCGPGGIYAKLTSPEARDWFVSRGLPEGVFPKEP